MENIFGNRYDLTTITVDGQKYLITNEDYRWLMEKLRLVNKQYQPPESLGDEIDATTPNQKKHKHE